MESQLWVNDGSSHGLLSKFHFVDIIFRIL